VLGKSLPQKWIPGSRFTKFKTKPYVGNKNPADKKKLKSTLVKLSQWLRLNKIETL
jgi:hypothetical protein